MRISDQSLFIRDLGRDFRPEALNNRNDTGNVTTMAVGEEGGGEVTTMALGEEGGGEMTTMALGEEGGGEVTTMALGEEGGETTTMALGEEGPTAAGPDSEPTQLKQVLELFIRDFGR